MRKKLESIVHPAVRRECKRRLDDLEDTLIAAVLVPLLFEAGLEAEYDEVWTVVADETALRERLKQRDRLSDQEIDGRLSAQWSQDDKAGLANRTIDNSGTIEQTRDQVQKLVQETMSSIRNSKTAAAGDFNDHTQ
jgi:dephospho-CoA kinase